MVAAQVPMDEKGPIALVVSHGAGEVVVRHRGALFNL